MTEEGYIKFNANWKKSQPISSASIQYINNWRAKMYAFNLIGAYPNGIGFGNISQRIPSDQGLFMISGSKTGNFQQLTGKDYAIVTEVDVPKNTLSCYGSTVASSESMSHAVIYQECEEVHGVIHVHHLELWKKLLFNVPTTASNATYGSPEMANSIVCLLQTTDLKQQKIFAMKEHQEGIFVFGKDLEEAANVLLGYYQLFNIDNHIIETIK